MVCCVCTSWLMIYMAFAIRSVKCFTSTSTCRMLPRSNNFLPTHHRSCRQSSTMHSHPSQEDHYSNQTDTDNSYSHHLYKRFHKFRSSHHHAPNIDQIFLLSDLHMDYPANQEWLYNLCCSNSTSFNPIDSTSMIIVAGDVSHDLEIIQWTFRTLKCKFDEIVFTIGNHELWLDKERKLKVATKLDADDDDVIKCQPSGKGDGCTDSIEKLERVLQLCVDEDVRIGPVKVGPHTDQIEGCGNKNDKSLWVIPFLSWHHHSFDTEPIVEGWGGIPSARKVVADYRRTTWSIGLSATNDTVAQFIDGLNDIILDLDHVVQRVVEEEGNHASLLTFSHFLPRIELLPEKRYLSLPTLPSCVGSTFLENRLRSLRRSLDMDNSSNEESSTEHLHAFGHTHLAWDHTIDNVRYVHSPLAYPREWEQRRRSLEIGSMKGENENERYPVCIWTRSPRAGPNNDREDSYESLAQSCGFPSEWLGGWWSKYYNVMPRMPHRSNYLAPWSARRFRQLPGGKIEDFDHVKVEAKHQLQCPSRSGQLGRGIGMNRIEIDR